MNEVEMVDARRWNMIRVNRGCHSLAVRGLLKQLGHVLLHKHRWLFIAGVSMILLSAFLPVLKGA